jgi:hypothetical protein
MPFRSSLNPAPSAGVSGTLKTNMRMAFCKKIKQKINGKWYPQSMSVMIPYLLHKTGANLTTRLFTGKITKHLMQFFN